MMNESMVIVMNIKQIAAIFSIFVGISMIGMWSMFLISDSIPELEDEPYRISMHILAEIATGVLLIISGSLLIRKNQLTRLLFPFSMGMLIYTLIQSPGYYIQRGELPFPVMFAIILVFSILILTKYYQEEAKKIKGQI